MYRYLGFIWVLSAGSDGVGLFPVPWLLVSGICFVVYVTHVFYRMFFMFCSFSVGLDSFWDFSCCVRVNFCVDGVGIFVNRYLAFLWLLVVKSFLVPVSVQHRVFTL